MRQLGWGRAAGIIVLGMLGLSGLVSCGQSSAPTPSPPPTASVPTPGTPTDFCPFGLPTRLVQRCGLLSVPARHSEPQGTQLRLPYVIFGAGARPSAHATVILQGGPGGGSGRLAQEMSRLLTQALPKDDIIVFDQRGVGESIPVLDCAANPLLGLLRPEALLEQTQRCLNDSRARGIDLADFNTRSSADDVALLARTLGYTGLNLYGMSYGTRLAQEVVRRSPALVRSLVLDGVLDPAESWVPMQTRSLHDTLRAFGTFCAAAGQCPDGPDLPAQLQSAAEAVDSAGLTFSSFGPGGTGAALPITGELLLMSARDSGARPQGLLGVPSLLRGVRARNAEVLSALPYRAEAAWQGLNLGTFLAVVCQDNALDTATIAAAHAGLPPVFMRGARLYQSLGQVCVQAGLSAPPAALTPVSAAIPTLLLSGRFDVVTPPAAAERVASRFSASRHVIFEAGGHVNGLGSPCGQQLLLTFLNSPAATLDTRCAASLEGAPSPATPMPPTTP